MAKLDRCRYWLDTGAIPSETVSSLLKKSGVEHKQLRLPRPGKPKVAAARCREEGSEAAPADVITVARSSFGTARPASRSARARQIGSVQQHAKCDVERRPPCALTS